MRTPDFPSFTRCIPKTAVKIEIADLTTAGWIDGFPPMKPCTGVHGIGWSSEPCAPCTIFPVLHLGVPSFPAEHGVFQAWQQQEVRSLLPCELSCSTCLR